MKCQHVELSVIIPCLNGADFIGDQLRALSKQKWSGQFEVIVADNGSTDGSQKVVMGYENLLPGLRIVDASDRKGQPHALNVGVRAASSDAVAFCDADDVVGPGWVQAMGEMLQKFEFVAGAFDIEMLNETWLQKSHGNPQKDGLNKYRYPPYMVHAGSGNMGVRKRAHESVGGFDETMPILFDTDYCWRLQLGGVNLHFVPNAIIYVRYRKSFISLYRQARNYGQYNVLLYKKYRRHGMPRLSRRQGVQAIAHLLRRLPRIRRKDALWKWIWDFGWRMGRLEGSVRYRVFAL